MRPTRRLWQLLAVVFVLSFAVLGWIGREIYLAAPPIPATVATTTGEVLFTGEDIRRGQQAWLSAGGQQLGSVWGHGSYVAPDWSADWLHREALELRDPLELELLAALECRPRAVGDDGHPAERLEHDRRLPRIESHDRGDAAHSERRLVVD